MRYFFESKIEKKEKGYMIQKFSAEITRPMVACHSLQSMTLMTSAMVIGDYQPFMVNGLPQHLVLRKK